MRILAFFLLIQTLALFLPLDVQAQDVIVKRSTLIENYKGKAYYIHFVGQGETLTLISKTYGVSIDDIVSENSFVEKGLQADMVLRIPQNGSTESQKVQTPVVKSTEPDKVPIPAKLTEPQKEVSSNVQNQDFTLYKVKKQETLYGIAKQYNLSVDDILNANPGFTGLKEGTNIKIPLKSTKVVTSKTEVQQVSKQTGTPNEITVKTGETLYSISKQYNTTVDELIELNPQLSGGLKAGMVISLKKHEGNKNDKESPKTEEKSNQVKTEKSSLAACYNPENKSKTYQVALLLPFLLDESTEALDAPDEKVPSGYDNFNYFQFYAGFMMAADSLEKLGLHARIQVLDAEKLNDTLVIRQTLRTPGLDKMDLLVGPLYAPSFSIAARFAKKHKIGIVNPFSRRESIVDSNPFVIKNQVSNSGNASALYSFVSRNHPDANVIIVRQDNKEMKLLADAFKELLKKGSENQSFKGTFQESVFATESIAGVTKKLKNGSTNIVVLFSNNSTTVPNFVSLLNPSSKTNNIILIGMEGWAELSLETEFLVNLHFHQLSSSFVVYDSEAVKEFSAKFIKKYGATPLATQHAFLGYDIGWYFLTSLMWYGENYLSCLPSNIGKGLQYNFDFSALKPEDGLQNTKSVVYKLEDYKMVPIE